MDALSLSAVWSADAVFRAATADSSLAVLVRVKSVVTTISTNNAMSRSKGFALTGWRRRPHHLDVSRTRPARGTRLQAERCLCQNLDNMSACAATSGEFPGIRGLPRTVEVAWLNAVVGRCLVGRRAVRMEAGGMRQSRKHGTEPTKRYIGEPSVRQTPSRCLTTHLHLSPP